MNIAFLLMSISVRAQFVEAFEYFQSSKALSGASVGVCFIDIETGVTSFGNNEHSFFYPASVQKTVTTATALTLLGADFQYNTKASYSGVIEDGVLNGNIIISGVGDPTTNSAYFNPNFKADIIQAIKAAGIKRIEGKVLFELGASQHGTPQSWLYEDIGNYYGVAPQTFNYKDNLYKLVFNQKSGGQTPTIHSIQPTVPYNFDLLLTCSASEKGDNAYILGSPFTLDREIVGTIGAGSGTFRIKGANANPQWTFIEELKEEFGISGIKKTAGGKEVILSNTKSPKLSKIAQTTNFESINLFAEGLLYSLGLNFAKEYHNESGIEVIEEYMAQKQLNTKEIKMYDGSGLSRLNAMTPHFAANWICEHYENESFRVSLPVAGETGTMRYLNHPGVKGLIHAKSGSAEGVVNYSGYFKGKEGKTYAFAIFINQAYQSKYSIRREIGAFLEKCM